MAHIPMLSAMPSGPQSHAPSSSSRITEIFDDPSLAATALATGANAQYPPASAPPYPAPPSSSHAPQQPFQRNRALRPVASSSALHDASTAEADPVAKIQRQRTRLLRALQDLDLAEQRHAQGSSGMPSRRRSLSSPAPAQALHIPAGAMDRPDVVLPHHHHGGRPAPSAPPISHAGGMEFRDLDADIEDLLAEDMELERLAGEISGGDYDILGEGDEVEWRWEGPPGGEDVIGVRRRK
ncbi:hypothetical protein HDV00_002256 [Rhizophlyctis rosea]|nr:hypothetical protein HDV00_002256 [Rhizophlyctis rosea]